jgi:anti-sigma regulatory factor (Ser/Thr protein kinase)
VSGTPSPESIAIELRRDLADLAILAERVEAFGERHGLAAGLVSTMNLALEEAVTNIIDYGFDDGDAPVIKVGLSCEEWGLTALIEDNGRPFNPLQTALAATDAPLEERQIGGLGITLIRKLMDDVQYRRNGSKNVLVLRKRA